MDSELGRNPSIHPMGEYRTHHQVEKGDSPEPGFHGKHLDPTTGLHFFGARYIVHILVNGLVPSLLI